MNIAIIMFLIVAVIAVLAIAAAIVLLFVGRSKKKGMSSSEPLPGGGGTYIMQIEGMSCEHCKANVEAALNAFEGVAAKVDLKTETAHIRYAGYPDLTLLDRLRRAVEDAGFTVSEIR